MAIYVEAQVTCGCQDWIVRLQVASWRRSRSKTSMSQAWGSWKVLLRMFLDGSRSQVKVSSLTLVSLYTHVSQEASISLFQRWTWNRVEPCSWNSDNNDLPELAQPEEDEIQGHLVWVWISWGRKRVMTGGRIASSNIFLHIWSIILMWMCFAVVTAVFVIV